MGGDGMPGARRAADLQRHHRLAGRFGALKRGGETLRLPDGFDKGADDLGLWVVGQIFEVIGRGQHRFVAGRYDVAEAEAPDVGQQGHAKGAALRDDADIAGKARRVAQFLQIGRAGMMRVEDAHAIGAAQCDPGLTTDRGDLRLQPAAVLAPLGKAAVIDDRSSHSTLGCGGEGVEHALMAHAE